MIVAAPILPHPEYLKDLASKEHYTRRLSQLKAERTPHETDWRDITESIMPLRGRYMLRDKDKSKRANRNIINSVAFKAQRTCTAGLKAGIASPARPWFKLGLHDSELAKYAPVKMWLAIVAQKIYIAMATSNFYNSQTVQFGDLANFGNGIMVTDEDAEDSIRSTTFAPGEYFLGQSFRNAINSVYREYTLPVVETISQFGIEKVSRSVRTLYDTGNYNANVTIVHCIEPNIWYDSAVRGWRRMPYSACYFEQASDDGAFLERKGYNEWPVGVSRWDVQSGDIYASGPGLVALGDARAIQTLERRKAQGIDKLIVPDLQAPIHLRNMGVNRTPGGTTFVDSNTNNRPITPIYEIPSHGIQQVREEIREHEQRIKEAYFVDLFMMLSQSDRREITAREVDELHEEKLFNLGPMLERNHDENLNVQIGRVYRILERNGEIPPVPKELAGKKVIPQYVSLLAYAQKAASINSIERGVQFVGQLAGGQKTIVNKMNFERTVDEYFDAIGFPASAMATDDEYKKSVKEYQDQVQQQIQAEQAKQMVDSAGVLANADTVKPNALTDILGLAGG